jgi:hypothetical protein
MATKGEGSSRGGTMGRQDQIGGGTVGLDRRGQTGRNGGVQSGLEERDGGKQRGGIGGEPKLEDKQRIQPTHVVDSWGSPGPELHPRLAVCANSPRASACAASGGVAGR